VKSIIRKEILRQRRDMSPEDVAAKSEQILSRLTQLPIIRSPQVILCYMDFRNEVQTEAIIEHLFSLDKIVVLPRVNPHTNHLDLFRIEGFKDLITSPMGILEPEDNLSQVLPTDIDLIFAPGVAFDLNGYRMGYGGGYYDKLLPQLRPDCAVIGLAFDLQIVPELPIEDHDQSMDAILTETRWIQANPKLDKLR
jgi:5-formyltetrahydrofolate cyclo-ligase